MTVESVGGLALGLSRPRAMLSVFIAVSVTIAAGVALLLPTPAANAHRITGTDGDDHLIGTAGPDRIRGRDGDDVISAGGRKDDVNGQAGNDVIRMGGNTDSGDLAFGGLGNDTIFGGVGDDRLFDVQGRDELNGGRGDDSLEVGRGADHVRGGPGNDGIGVLPDGRPDLIECGLGRDTVFWAGNRHEGLDKTTGCEREVFTP